MTDVQITKEDNGSKVRYAGRVDGYEGEAELTLSIASADKVIADHTFVPKAMRGNGVGGQLVERLVADAREQGFTIVPLCPFVKAEAEQHPDWSDVFV